MKNYSTEVYYEYARRIVEGESGQTNLPDKSDDGQFKKMIIGAGTGAVGAVACMRYLGNVFNMGNLQSTIKGMRDYSDWVSKTTNLAKDERWAKHMPSLWQKITGVIKGLVAKALNWVYRFCQGILKQFPSLRKPIFGGPAYKAGANVPTYGSVLCMALVGAAVGAVIYRIYKFIKNRRKKTESVAAFNARKNREYKAILVETVAFFDNLDRLTEAPYSNPLGNMNMFGIGWNNVPFGSTPAPAAPAATGIPNSTVNAAAGVMNDTGSSANKALGMMRNKPAMKNYSQTPNPTQGPTIANAKNLPKGDAPAKAEGFLNSMKERLMAMWTSVKTWCTNNPMLATMVGICAALVACWYGVKKYKESQAKKAGAAQTQS